MKKQLLGLMTILTILNACQKNEVSVSLPEEVTIHATIEDKDATKTIMDESNNILWSVNDQIIAFMKSSYGYKYQVKPSFVGKSFADFSMVSSGNSSDLSAGNEWKHNVVYYPYSENIECLKSGANYALEVNLPAEQTYVPDSFANGSMAMVAISENNNITFRNVLGGFKLQLKGTQKVASIKIEGKNNEKLAGAATVTAYTDETKPAITMASGASTSVTLNCGEGVQLNESSATEFIISLPPVLFSQGFIVKVTDSSEETYTVETDKANTVLRSSILIMPPVILVNDNTEDKEDNTDSEIIVLDITFDKTTLNLAPNTSYSISTQVVPDIANNKTLFWSSSDPTIAQVNQSGVITAISDGITTITAVAIGGASRSCIVNVISFPTSEATEDYIDEYGINHGKGTAIGGTVWAPVNCGYKTAKIENGIITDKGFPYGKLYQWGRKYGQGYSADSDSEPLIYHAPVSDQIGNNVNMAGYFFSTTGNSDWIEPTNDSMWNEGTEDLPVKTSNDPCPKGWRVPTYKELRALSTKSSNLTTDDDSINGCYFSGASTTIYDTPPLTEDIKIFLPAAGSRNYDGIVYSRNVRGDYWSSRPNTYYHAYNLYFKNGKVDMFSNCHRPTGNSIRCVQE